MINDCSSDTCPLFSRHVLEVKVDLAQSGMTMLYVTHEMAFARKVANRINFLD